MNLAQQIRAAGESLNSTNWIRGRYFSWENTLCMCSHGAMQLQSNPAVKKALASCPIDGIADDVLGGVIPAIATDAVAAVSVAAGDAGAGELDNALYTSNVNIVAIWNRRPSWVRNSTVEGSFLLGLVGLTADFNDSPDTTLEMVKAKFIEAAALAEHLGV